MWSKRTQGTVLAVLLGVTLFVGLRHQAIVDWLRLRNYTAPAVVQQLSTQDSMTAYGRHLFYVNHPRIATGTAFTGHCPAGSEKTVVLGCYIGNDNGIFIYHISDARLNGVEQVTAAHEMLHAAYQRLSSGERKTVNAMLVNYYEHGLTDQRIKDTIAAYKKSEPNDVVNEMHSVFGTEVAQLPAPLEAYYKQYFTNRSVVTSYTASYQAEFTSRQTAVAQYDTQLKTLKAQITDNQSELGKQKAAITTAGDTLQAERDSGQLDAYNRGVATYNQQVTTYNSLLETTKDQINQYNSVVDERNSVVLEEQQLTQELSASSLPSN